MNGVSGMHGKGDCSDHWSAASSFWFVRFISGGFFLPSPLCTVRSTSRWSTQVSISSPPSSFRSLLCQPFVLSWWLHPLDAVRGGLGRERLDTPLTQTLYTQLAKHSAPFMVRCTQRAVTHLPTRSQCFRFTVGVQYVLFLSENPHNFFISPHAPWQ